MRFFLLLLIRVYRAAISPLVGPCCRFEPSCSAYAEEALREHGALRGTALTLWRLARCHPFARAGLDPVPRRGTDRVDGRPALPAGAHRGRFGTL